MSINPITPNEIENFTVETHPFRTYTSSSVSGSTGDVYVFSRRSAIEKNPGQQSSYLTRTHSDNNIDSRLKTAHFDGYFSGSNYNDIVSYMAAVDTLPISSRKQSLQSIVRFTPPDNYNENTARKNVIRTLVMPYHRNINPTSHYNYTNYHSINFFTASTVPTSSVIMYPNYIGENSFSQFGIYTLVDQFTFDFWINPRYTTDMSGAAFNAGTIFHLSGNYAVSLVTGSSVDVNGQPDAYRLLLQLNNGASIVPSTVTGSNLNTGSFCSLSNDNVLLKNHWHHVSIRWSNIFSQNTGSFYVDGTNQGNFIYNSNSAIKFNPFSDVLTNPRPTVLYIGNFYQGGNSGLDSEDLFFSLKPSEREGLQTISFTPDVEGPNVYAFNNPLNAEVNELKIYNRFLTDTEVSQLGKTGPATTDNLIFYLPPFFSETSPTSTFDPVSGQGGQLLTPFYSMDGTSNKPFNQNFAFGVGGHSINLQNFMRDYANTQFPRLYNLSSSAIVTSTPGFISANEFIYSTGSSIKRNLTILPCDNGLFSPNYSILSEWYQPPVSTDTIYQNDLGSLDLSSINLSDLLDLRYKQQNTIDQASGAILSSSVVTTPDDLTHVLPNQNALTIYQRTKDDSSNQITIFDISNLFYGNSIKPGTLNLIDTNLSGSSGKVPIILKDDGYGNIYRASSETPLATWNSVGNIYYQEGIIIIKSPHLMFFGQDQFTISFNGVQNVYSLKFKLLAKASDLTVSTNPSYIPGVTSSTNANQPVDEYVYITNINIHDDNLNVIAKSNLAQAVVKRFGDKIMFIISIMY